MMVPMPKVSPDYLLERREHILAAAARRFAADGFHRTSMADVIDEAGLSPGAVYRYFRGKEEIIVAISLAAMGAVTQVIHDALRDHRPFPELISALPAALLQVPDADDRLRLAVQAWGEALRNPGLADAMRHGLDELRAALRERVHHDTGDEPDPIDADATADALIALVQGFILQRSWQPTLDARTYGDACAQIVGGRLTTARNA